MHCLTLSQDSKKLSRRMGKKFASALQGAPRVRYPTVWKGEL